MPPSVYSQRSLTVLVLLGVLAAIMSVLAATLVFQIQAQQGAVKEGPALPTGVLLPVCTGLAALCLTLNACCVIVCLLHAYFSTEVCREQGSEPDRGDWFLLDTRIIRHVAVGLFCFGVAVYLAALSIYMLLLFEMETGVTSACILSSGILVLLLTATHAIFKASQAKKRGRNELANTMYENDSAHGGETPVNGSNNVKETPNPRPRPEIHREFSYPPYVEKSQPISPTRSDLTSVGSQGTAPSHMSSSAEKDGYTIPRMHRTLSAESGLLRSHSKPWNGITQEMRTMMTRKQGLATKDSTLV
ncbi:transmembrane protein 221 [Ambystoma mexicanum]|uniref:transmembrane protein 221 n=1 Tax=Ambystoma mexicanum TaxID=8296 RepID=UPI0037E89D21